eukprot:764613-Hanusia_phi.AAC.3
MRLMPARTEARQVFDSVRRKGGGVSEARWKKRERMEVEGEEARDWKSGIGRNGCDVSATGRRR